MEYLWCFCLPKMPSVFSLMKATDSNGVRKYEAPLESRPVVPLRPSCIVARVGEELPPVTSWFWRDFPSDLRGQLFVVSCSKRNLLPFSGGFFGDVPYLQSWTMTPTHTSCTFFGGRSIKMNFDAPTSLCYFTNLDFPDLWRFPWSKKLLFEKVCKNSCVFGHPSSPSVVFTRPAVWVFNPTNPPVHSAWPLGAEVLCIVLQANMHVDGLRPDSQPMKNWVEVVDIPGNLEIWKHK